MALAIKVRDISLFWYSVDILLSYFPNCFLIGLEKQFGLQIDRETIVKLKHLNFKGRVEPTIMRKRKKDGGSEAECNGETESDAGANKENDPMGNFPYPYESGVTSEELARKQAQQVCCTQTVPQLLTS